MKFLFICLGNPFTENMLYKENYFIRACIEDGHSVSVLADTRKYIGKDVIDVGEENYKIGDNLNIIRINYDKIITSFISQKIRKCRNWLKIVLEIVPDVIFFNCIQVYNICDLSKLKKVYPNIRIYGDVSTTLSNSAQNFISYYFLHKIIYRSWIKSNIKYFNKIFYVVPESKSFLEKVYGIKENKLEFNPLPCEVVDYDQKRKNRNEMEEKYQIPKEHIIFSHTGKMNSLKFTLELIRIFISYKCDFINLIIAGEFEDEIKQEAMTLIKSDDRIKYIGFLTGKELTKLLCATDMYLQPGSPSQTAQTAIGCWCPVVLANSESYLPFYNGNGYLIDSVFEIKSILENIARNPDILKLMSEKSEKIAKDMLDYKVLIRAIY